jgi:hypothetical protein
MSEINTFLPDDGLTKHWKSHEDFLRPAEIPYWSLQGIAGNRRERAENTLSGISASMTGE